MIAHLEMQSVTHVALVGPINGTFNLVRVDVVTRHLTAGESGEVVGNPSPATAHIQEVRSRRVL